MKRAALYLLGLALELAGIGDPPMCRGWKR